MAEERRKGTLSDEEFEAVANRAAEIVQQQVYAAVGKGIITKALWIVGAGLLALAAWLAGAGKIKIGG